MVLQANRKRKSKPLIQNVMAQWAEGKEKGTLHTCYKAWRDSIAGIKSVEAQRKLDLALADNARLQELAATQKREVSKHWVEHMRHINCLNISKCCRPSQNPLQ
eukprot:3160890-Amphidinium_carterae.1